MNCKLMHGDCRKVLTSLPAESVHCVVTSPPYYKQRDYEDNNQIGQEETPTLYLDSLWEVFNKVYRVLRPDGVLFLNIGDKYVDGELLGLPWDLVFRLKRQGWRLCQEIIWHKPNPLTSGSPRRCVPAHEHIFLFSKRKEYLFDKEAIKEKGVEQEQAHKRSVWTIGTKGYKGAHFATFPPKLAETCIRAGCPSRVCKECGRPFLREIFRERIPTRPGTKTKATRAVSVQGNRDPKRHVTRTKTLGWKAQCECNAGHVGGTVLDPFGGAGTVGLVAEKLNRSSILVEVNADYIAMARERIAKGGSRGFGLMGE